MANYLVTGGAGFIGSNIVSTLVKRGDQSPWSLLLLLVLPLWLWRERRSAQRGGLKFSSVATAQSLSSVWSALGPSLLLVLRGATLALFFSA